MTACLASLRPLHLLGSRLLTHNDAGLVRASQLALVKSARHSVLVAVVLASASQPDVWEEIQPTTLSLLSPVQMVLYFLVLNQSSGIDWKNILLLLGGW